MMMSGNTVQTVGQPIDFQYSGTVTFTADALLRSVRLIAPGPDQIFDIEQNWYWTSEWQAEERQSVEDYDAGRYQEFSSMDDFIDSLDAPDR